ncbi:hypothetical protein [Treponema medium]|uniref:hypothetical protein n=1 Tax=Treponema medium TaxID=58231 RepID=UPI0020916061|nr:hypothetical protein [Treponema medium]
MKKLLFISMFVILASSFTFAEAKSTGGGNGNGGKDKIGGYIGSPFGLSYSHEFNDLVELDLVAGYSGLLAGTTLIFNLEHFLPYLIRYYQVLAINIVHYR